MTDVGFLHAASIEVLGLLPYASNYTFLARLGDEEAKELVIYKPTRGERPLWDFPHGTLAAREAAAYLVSEAAGWGIVPPTVLRTEGPLGGGSLQSFIEHDPDLHYFILRETRLDDFEAFAAFDVVTNNADRKAGHVLQDADGRLWAVDHGLTFNVEDKLRTVIWEFADQPIGEEARSKLERLAASLDDPKGVRAELAGLLTDEELAALSARTALLLRVGTYPKPGGLRPYPWPLV
ncbi:MAG: SCO1664 family protein [Actinomycetota bacterium]